MTDGITISALESKIALLKRCVEFYSDKNNYGKTLSDNTKSQIDLDEGHIARHTIKTLSDLDALQATTVAAFEELQKMADENPEEVMKRIKAMANNNE